jgi:hypothetical protein
VPSWNRTDKVAAAALVLSFLAFSLSLAQAIPPYISAAFPPDTCEKHPGLREVRPGQSSASSTLSPQGAFTFNPQNAADGDAKTAWAPAGSDGGRGQQIDFIFSAAIDLRLVCIINGYALNQDIYSRNGRIRDVATTTAQESETGTLRNQPTEQLGDFQDVPIRQGATDRFQLAIAGFYSGIATQDRRGYLDTCTSELQFYAKS